MITVTYANSNDGFITSSASSYSAALAGTGTVTTTNGSTFFRAGQDYSDGTRRINQYFSEYSYAIPTDTTTVFGYWLLYNNTTYGTNVDRRLEFRTFDWGGGTLTDADYRTPSQITALPGGHRGALSGVQRVANGSYFTVPHFHIEGDLQSSGTKRYITYTSRNRLQQAPSGGEFNHLRTTEVAGTEYDPRLVTGHVRTSMMNPMLGAQCQLTDGTWLFLERTSMDREFTWNVVHMDTAGNRTVVDSFTFVGEGLTGTDNYLGAQAFALCRDQNDDFFICDSSPNRTDIVNIRAWTKGVGYTWTRGDLHSVPTPEEHGNSNIQAMTMVHHQFLDGRLMVFASRDVNEWVSDSRQEFVMYLHAARIKGTASGNPLLYTDGIGISNLTPIPAQVATRNPMNPTGTLLDAAASPGTAAEGYIVTAERNLLEGGVGPMSVGRYRLHSNGVDITVSTRTSFMDDGGGYALKDPDAKMRVIATGTSRATKITADDRADNGLSLRTFNFNASLPQWELVHAVRMDTESIPSFPTGGDLANSQSWDAVFMPQGNRIWIYYFDSADPTRLMRTSVTMNDGLAQKDEVEVTGNATPGGTADTIHSIRVQRNNMTSDHVLITIAYEDSVGDHHFEYVVDRINLTPTQPTPQQSANFDATASHDVTWTFRDPNLIDAQTAYQVQVVNATDMSVDLDTGKVSSATSSHTIAGGTLTNNLNYLWRVRTYDSVDAVSPWSDYSTFTTSNTGILNIVSPATDNEDIFTRDVLLDWSVTGATPDSYRVVVTRVDNGSTFLDTGWVTSAATEHLVENLVSDVQYSFTVTGRTNMVETNSDTVLVIVSYATPEVPVVDVTHDGADLPYLTVTVENPEPRGDRPEVTVNHVFRREVGTNEKFRWVGSCGRNSSFLDFTVGAGISYEYKVRGGVADA